MAVDGDVGGRGAEAGYIGVVADLKGERLGGAAVDAGLEEQSVALSAELVADLLSGDGIDRCLNLAGGHAGIEDEDVGAEVGRACTGLGEGRRDGGEACKKCAEYKAGEGPAFEAHFYFDPGHWGVSCNVLALLDCDEDYRLRIFPLSIGQGE